MTDFDHPTRVRAAFTCLAAALFGGFANGIAIGNIGQLMADKATFLKRHPPSWCTTIEGCNVDSRANVRDSLLMACMQAGALLGAALAGIIADRFGRRTSCIFAGLAQALGGALCGFDFLISDAARASSPILVRFFSYFKNMTEYFTNLMKIKYDYFCRRQRSHLRSTLSAASSVASALLRHATASRFS